MRPLNDLLKKNVVFEWKEAQQHDCQFHLECDTFNYTTGAVLSILKEDKWHPVTYYSHSMSPEEWNYLIADKEMLSVIRGLKIWRHYLEGTKYEFKV